MSKLESRLYISSDYKRNCAGGLRTKGHFKSSFPDKPLISIITVVLNGEKHLEETIKSVINQTYENVEYIIMDGGSTDSSLEIIQKYENQIDYWVSENDNGIYDAMNKATTLINGDWCCFVGSDDYLLDCFYTVKKYLQNKQCVYYGDVVLSSSGKIYGGVFNSYKLMTKNIPHQAILYPRAVFEKYCYSALYPYLADYCLNLMLYADKDFVFKYVNIVYACYNNTGRSSSVVDVKFNKDKSGIIKKYYEYKYKIPYFAAKIIKKILSRAQ